MLRLALLLFKSAAALILLLIALALMNEQVHPRMLDLYSGFLVLCGAVGLIFFSGMTVFTAAHAEKFDHWTFEWMHWQTSAFTFGVYALGSGILLAYFGAPNVLSVADAWRETPLCLLPFSIGLCLYYFSIMGVFFLYVVSIMSILASMVVALLEIGDRVIQEFRGRQEAQASR